MSEIEKPYWVASANEVPFWDFNREIIPAGVLSLFPNGAIGIRVDDDFWAVAALPPENYRDVPIQKIVAELWPELSCEATFGPDVVYRAKGAKP